MNTPIYNFVKDYAQSKPVRFHMPGHKGVVTPLNIEKRDITEIKGADYLFEADGIIGKSEENCAKLFGTEKTLYSTEGSSLSIKTMVSLLVMGRKDHSKRAEIIAPRNCHKAFINGCVLADADVVWVYPKEKSRSICQSLFTPEEIREGILRAENPCGVYITSPDYLGNLARISDIKKVCREFDIPLVVDNAHGSYLKFWDYDLHPITLGADMCCDSAHKTLPVLTGGGYLHISKKAPTFFKENAKRVMSMFASTSPSYLILQSLDLCNKTLSEDYKQKVKLTCERVSKLCQVINTTDFKANTFEPLKITVFTNERGYTGVQVADELRKFGVECEYADDNVLVMMASPYNSAEDFERATDAFLSIENRHEKLDVCNDSLDFHPKKAMSMRQAVFSPSERVSVVDALGRVCALTVTSCQPSVPVAVSGEIIDEEIIKIFKRYSIFSLDVVKCM